jgi:hypothetical protein
MRTPSTCRAGRRRYRQVRFRHSLAIPPVTRVQVFVQRGSEQHNPKCVHNHHREGKAVPTAVDAVNQHMLGHEHAVGFKSACQFLVGHLLGLAQFLDESFRPSRVKLTWLQFAQSYIVFDARMLNRFSLKKTHASNSIHCGQFCLWITRRRTQVIIT